MHRPFVSITAASFVLAAALSAGQVFAQEKSVKDQIAGSWTLVSIKAGSAEPYGANPKGVMFLGPNGQFSITIVREGVPKFASDNRTTGTADENKAAVQGTLAYFGSYAVNDKDQIIDMNVDASTYPNFNGTKQNRRFALAGDELTLTNPSPSGGGGAAAVQIWKRAK
jgi:hypothetical protein